MKTAFAVLCVESNRLPLTVFVCREIFHVVFCLLSYDEGQNERGTRTMNWLSQQLKLRRNAGILAFGFLLTGMSGCGGTPVWMRDDPAEVVSGYLSAVEGQNPEIVWEFLSSPTREKLEKRAEAFNEASDHGVSMRGMDMLRFGHVLSSTREYKKILVSSSDDRHATVHIVRHDESVIPIDLHRESERWVIDLPLD